MNIKKNMALCHFIKRPKRKRMRITSKKSKMSKHFYYFFYFLWEDCKRLKFNFALTFFLKVIYIVLTARN